MFAANLLKINRKIVAFSVKNRYISRKLVGKFKKW